MANHRGGSGNFAEDRERASEAGRKGGQHSGEFKMTSARI
jgi:general stress protein YciG